MEDALVQMGRKFQARTDREVLILVLMEDALVLGGQFARRYTSDSLNPCFNGRCTRTQHTSW